MNPVEAGHVFLMGRYLFSCRDRALIAETIDSRQNRYQVEPEQQVLDPIVPGHFSQPDFFHERSDFSHALCAQFLILSMAH